MSFSTHAPRTLGRAVATLAAAPVAILAFGTPALAHDVLIDSSPEDGAVLESSPPAIVLTYNNEPLDQSPVIQVTDESGETVADGDPVVAGTDVTLEDLPGLDAGEYDVFWRVVSSDGHPIEGDLSFTVEAAEEEPPAEETEPAPEPTEDPTQEAGEPAGELADEEDAANWALWGAIAAVAVVAGVVLTLVRRRGRS